jgi:hypothetical protein
MQYTGQMNWKLKMDIRFSKVDCMDHLENCGFRAVALGRDDWMRTNLRVIEWNTREDL